MNKHNHHHLAALAALLLCLITPLLARAASSTAVSPIFTVDLQVSPIAVSGRVLHATTRAALSGAAVTLAGQSTSSSGSGQFSFPTVSLSGANTLRVNKAGYATYTGTVPSPAGATVVTVPDVLLQLATVDNKPVVTGIRPKYDGLFLSAAAILNELTRQRQEGQGRVATALARAKALRPGLRARDAGDVIHALASPELYHLFVIDRAWSPERYERWLAEALAGQLLP